MEKWLQSMMKRYQMFVWLGFLFVIVGFIWALVFANGTVASYWNNSESQVLNAAAPGSALLAQLGVIKTTLPWLSFLRFAGMSLLFTAITVALSVIIRTLQFQEKQLDNFVRAQS